MMQKLKFNSFYVAVLACAVVFTQAASAQTFTCDEDQFIIGFGGPTAFNEVVVSGSTVTLNPLFTTAESINALATDPVSGLIHGVEVGTRNILTVNASGTVVDTGFDMTIPVNAVSGTFDTINNKYIVGSANRIEVIDMTTGSSSVILIPAGDTISDFSFNLTDGLIWGFEQNADELIGIDPLTGSATYITPNPNTGTGAIELSGATFMGSDGFLYLYGDTDGVGAAQDTFFRADLTTGAVTVIGTGDPVTSVDGTSCLTEIVTDLEMMKTINTSSPVQDSNVTYTLTVNNPSAIAATNITVSDALPSGLTFVSSTGNGTYDDTTGVWTIANINSSDVAVLNIVATVTASPGTVVTNTANITGSDTTDPNTSNDSANVDLTVVDFDTFICGLGDNIIGYDSGSTQFATVELSGASAVLTPLFTTTGSEINGLAIDPVSGLMYGVEWNTKNIMIVGADGNVTYSGFDTTIAAVTQGVITPNRLYVIGNNAGDLEIINLITGTSSTISYPVGQIMYDFAYNPGDGLIWGYEANGNQLMSFDITTGAFGYLAANPNSGPGSINEAGAAFMGNDGYLYLYGRQSGSPLQDTFFQADLTTGDIVVAGSNGPPVTAVDGASCLQDEADLVMNKVVDNASPMAGDTITYTLTVTNNGPHAVGSIVVQDVLPSAVTFVSATGSTGYSSGAGLWNIPGILLNGSSATLDITVTVNASSSFTNTASIISASVPDPNDSNNQDSADIYFEIVFGDGSTGGNGSSGGGGGGRPHSPSTPVVPVVSTPSADKPCLEYVANRPLSFTDVNTNTLHEDAIDALMRTRIITAGEFVVTGRHNHNNGENVAATAQYFPLDTVTRLVATKIALTTNCIAVVDSIPAGVQNAFSDLSFTTNYSDPALEYAQRVFYTAYINDIVRGRVDGTVGPFDMVNKAEAIAIGLRAAMIELQDDANQNTWFSKYQSFNTANNVMLAAFNAGDLIQRNVFSDMMLYIMKLNQRDNELVQYGTTHAVR